MKFCGAMGVQKCDNISLVCGEVFFCISSEKNAIKNVLQVLSDTKTHIIHVHRTRMNFHYTYFSFFSFLLFLFLKQFHAEPHRYVHVVRASVEKLNERERAAPN